MYGEQDTSLRRRGDLPAWAARAYRPDIGLGFNALATPWRCTGEDALPPPQRLGEAGTTFTTLSERVYVGLSRAKAQGKILGRPKAALRPERVLRLKERGLSMRQIAAETAVSAMTVQRILAGQKE